MLDVGMSGDEENIEWMCQWCVRSDYANDPLGVYFADDAYERRADK